MVEVTDEDRQAAERLALGQPFTCFDCADELAKAFARHRIAAGQRGKMEGARLAIEAAAKDAEGWFPADTSKRYPTPASISPRAHLCAQWKDK